MFALIVRFSPVWYCRYSSAVGRYAVCVVSERESEGEASVVVVGESTASA